MAKTVAVAEQTGSALGPLKTGPARLGEFLKDVRSEMRKVVWPGREDVQTTTIVVIVTVFIFAAYFALVDFFVGHAIDQLLKHVTNK